MLTMASMISCFWINGARASLISAKGLVKSSSKIWQPAVPAAYSLDLFLPAAMTVACDWVCRAISWPIPDEAPMPDHTGRRPAQNLKVSWSILFSPFVFDCKWLVVTNDAIAETARPEGIFIGIGSGNDIKIKEQARGTVVQVVPIYASPASGA